MDTLLFTVGLVNLEILTVSERKFDLYYGTVTLKLKMRVSAKKKCCGIFNILQMICMGRWGVFLKLLADIPTDIDVETRVNRVKNCSKVL